VHAPENVAETPSTSPGRGLVIAGALTGSVEIAAIGFGIFAAYRANTLEPKRERAHTTQERNPRNRTLAWVSLGVGAASLATGTVLVFVGLSKHEASTAAIAPVVGQGAGGASFFGRF
jgi:purine-cytosine permease-like protein